MNFFRPPPKKKEKEKEKEKLLKSDLHILIMVSSA
jgi:hypothetical protein